MVAKVGPCTRGRAREANEVTELESIKATMTLL